jgi:DNA-directed RNA polymerase subunit RPC12/RpoP
MKVRVQVVIETEAGGSGDVHEILEIERAELRPETMGLTLEEAKTVLEQIQQRVVEQQAAEYLRRQSRCPHCGNKRLHKGEHTVTIRTLFGKFQLQSPRLYHCQCQPHPPRTFSPLAERLPERSTPELLYLETKWASLMSYGMTTKLLAEVLPIGKYINAATVRNHVHAVAQRTEAELGEEQVFFSEGCPRDWGNLPRPEGPLTVGLDGGYVHSCDKTLRKDGWFEVITGKSITAEGTAKCFALVHGYDTKPKRRVFDVLTSQGMQMNQQVIFLSDGGDTVRQLQLYLNPQAEHLLDWFHVTMRITVMTQRAKGLEGKDRIIQPAVLKELERSKWYLWHGNVYEACISIDNLELLLDSDDELTAKRRSMLKALRDFRVYVTTNARLIPNYGERYRYGEAIATGFVESTVNQVVSKRFVKKQQMKWSRRGAHLLLQMRTRVLNDELRQTFQQWYPGMKNNEEEMKLAA